MSGQIKNHKLQRIFNLVGKNLDILEKKAGVCKDGDSDVEDEDLDEDAEEKEEKQKSFLKKTAK